MPMTLVKVRERRENPRRMASAVFRVLPSMTKWEIKEYLQKIYDLPVAKVNTMNYQGKRKRIIAGRKIAYVKYRDFKKAIVTFDESVHDLGLGSKGLKLEDTEDDMPEE
eukprot:CAMPEP_0194053964 /NCGR_PEP_ID=MMETSP0009_2-20130614/51973_1 /TAXON_ID=210454 /ORGANISM="Grammatophora oceanica, Strain CCMP 410" /LENGTH=108 /DNA_ID=CAMNT_0038702293 /DNA_START=8 /DNA_END=334 /DNA_ORIENTATION=+